MNFAELKNEIKEITEIALSVPEPFRDRCFETLLTELLRGNRSNSTATEVAQSTLEPAVAEPKAKSNNGAFPLTATLRVFMKRTGVTQAQLEEVVMVEDGDVHFVKEPNHTTLSQGQFEWSLLLALKNGITKNSLSADPEDVRSICQEKAFYDKKNFAANFKNPRFVAAFKTVLEPQGEAQPLTSDGQDALGSLIKKLAGGVE